jgi:hypothetical protein
LSSSEHYETPISLNAGVLVSEFEYEKAKDAVPETENKLDDMLGRVYETALKEYKFKGPRVKRAVSLTRGGRSPKRERLVILRCAHAYAS